MALLRFYGMAETRQACASGSTGYWRFAPLLHRNFRAPAAISGRLLPAYRPRPRAREAGLTARSKLTLILGGCPWSVPLMRNIMTTVAGSAMTYDDMRHPLNRAAPGLQTRKR